MKKLSSNNKRVILALAILALAIGIFLYFANKQEQFDYEYTIKYSVYYSNSEVVTETRTSDHPFYVGSDRGSNFIRNKSKEGRITIIRTSAPIRIISNDYKKIKR